MSPVVFLVGTRWFGVLGPCRRMIEQLTDAGYLVVVFGQKDSHYQRYDSGRAQLVELRMRRRYFSPVSDLVDIFTITRLARRLKPVAIHSFNPKPSLLVLPAIRVGGIPHFFVGVTGLGNTFIRARVLRRVVVSALRRVAHRADFIFFQNPDDQEFFESSGIGSASKYRLFVGPGVDLEEFDIAARTRSPDESTVRFVCVARLIWQKGIREYVEAARRLLARAPGTYEFLLIGEFDHEHPDCVDSDFIARAVADDTIVHIPWTDDLPGVLAECDVNVLLSYREGAPRAILEASAMGLPTIGSDTIGVRELVKHRKTGLLTPLGDIDAVSEAMWLLANDHELRETMGSAAHNCIAVPLSIEAASTAQLEMYRAVGIEI